MRTLHATAYRLERLPAWVARMLVWLAGVVRAFLKQDPSVGLGPSSSSATRQVAGGPYRRADDPVEVESLTTPVDEAAARDVSTVTILELPTSGKSRQRNSAAISSLNLLRQNTRLPV